MPLHPEIVRTETALSDAKHELGRIKVEIAKRNADEYSAAGGCLRCHGDGHYTYVDMDGYGHSEKCVRENPETKRWDVVCDAPKIPYAGGMAQHAADVRLLADAEENLAIAKEQYERAVNIYDVVAGATVRVVKGRKVPIGTVGVVTGLYDGQWGTRVGIRVKEGEKTVYTALDNVLLVTSSFEQENDLPDLYGSPKQVSWATKIRSQAVQSGKVTVEVAQQYGNAKIWIDERDNLEAMQARMSDYLKKARAA